MTRKVFTKLMALFVLLLVFQTAAMELILAADGALHPVRRCIASIAKLLWSGLIALLVALPLAAWVASRDSARLQRVVTFARPDCAGGSERAAGERAATSWPRWKPR